MSNDDTRGGPSSRLDRGVSLRRATTDDAEPLFEWANDATTRAQSFSSTSIPWGDHVAWLAQKLADPTCVFYIAELDDGRPCATVRFDVRDGSADVSVTVASAFRGQGIATRALRAAIDAFFTASDAGQVRAFIKPGNAASVRVFERAGFVGTESTRAEARCLVRSRPLPRE